MRPMSKYFISLYFLFCLCFASFGQVPIQETSTDSVKFTEKYGLRLGGDLSKLLKSFMDDNYSGFEVNGDYRLTKNIYVASEIGFEEYTTINSYLNSTASGSYLKGGFDYNMYANWFGMENMIFAGFRVGVSSFKQILTSYTVYQTDQSWPSSTINPGTEFSGLNALWGELLIGIKAELFTNFYIGANVQLKGRASEKEPENFENIYIPGFGRTYDSGSFGINFGYNVSYLIPIYKKNNKSK